MLTNDYYRLPIEMLMNALRTSLQGLTSEEAAARLQHHGLNRLPENKRVTFLAVVIHQFMSPLIYVLVVAGIVSLFINEYEDAIFIFLIITINAILGTYQEWKSFFSPKWGSPTETVVTQIGPSID